MTNFKYNLSKHTPQAMPRLGKGTECVQLLLSQVSKDMHQPLVQCFSQYLRTHKWGRIHVSRQKLEGNKRNIGKFRSR